MSEKTPVDSAEQLRILSANVRNEVQKFDPDWKQIAKWATEADILASQEGFTPPFGEEVVAQFERQAAQTGHA